MTRISFLLCSLCECSSPNILYGYLAYFPIHPSALLPDLGGGIQAAPQKVTVMKSPSGIFGSQPYFSPSACSVCGVVGALMIFPGQAEVGVQVYSIYMCSLYGWGKKTKKTGGGDTCAEWRHFLVSLEIRHLALFV